MRWLLAFIMVSWAAAAQAQSPVWIDPSYRANEALANTAVTAAVASDQVACASACNLYGIQVTSSTTAGYVLLFNTTTAPADGAVTPVKCWKLAADATLEKFWGIGPPLRMTTGAVVSYSTTGCFTKTAEPSVFIGTEALLAR